MFNNAHPDFQISAFLVKCLAVMPKHTYIQTYILKNQNIYLSVFVDLIPYIFKCIRGSNSLSPSVIQKFLFFILAPLSLHTSGKRCNRRLPTYVTSKVSICVCI